MAAKVVDFPEPVGPVTNTKPRDRSIISSKHLGCPQFLEGRHLQGDNAKGSLWIPD